MESRKLTRRQMLKGTAVMAGMILAGCQAPPVQRGTEATKAVTEELKGETAVPPTVQPAVQLQNDPRKYLMDPPVNPPKYYSPMMVITQNKDMNQYQKFREGESIEDNVTTRYLKDIMGVDYKIVSACKGPESCPQAWATMLASGDIPDFVPGLYGVNLGQLMDADRLEDITDAFPQYASPLALKKKEWPDGVIWKPFTRKGRVYGIGYSNMGRAAHEPLLWVRQDWLDQLGLKIPDTLDQFYEVARAFVTEGLAPMGISAAGQSGVVDWQSTLDPFFGAFGVMPARWLKDDKGGLVYGSTLPDNKKALEVLQKWYKDGLIEPEFMTKGANKCSENMGGNNAGMFLGPDWSIGWPLKDSIANDPKAVWVWDDIPAGPDGTRGRAAFREAQFGCAFRKGVEAAKIEAVINHINWIYDMRAASPLENHMLFEGYDYVIEDGVAKDAGFTTMWAEPGGGWPTWYYPGMTQDEDAKLSKLAKQDPATLNPVEKMKLTDPYAATRRAASARILETLDWAMVDEYMGPPTPTQTEKDAYLNKLENETYIQIITGQLGVQDHDRFVQEWKSNGGDEITREVNEWYASL